MDTDFIERSFDNHFDPVAAVSESYRIGYWNEPMVRISGISSAEALGARVYDLFPRLLDTPADGALRRAVGGENVIGDRPFFAARDPTVAHEMDWFAMPYLSRSSPRGAVVLARSAAGRDSLGEAIRESEARFRAMADSSPVLLWMSGRHGLCQFFNKTWLEFSGRTMEEELGLGWAEGVHPEDFERCMSTYMRSFSARQPFEMDYRLRRHDGEYRWILDRGGPRFTSSGEFVGFIGSCIDVTDRKLAEDATRQLADHLARTNEELDAFAYVASHDLRGPLRAMSNLASWLAEDLDDVLSERARSYMSHLQRQVSRMDRFLDALLEYARVGHGAVVPEPVDVGELVHEIGSSLLHPDLRLVTEHLPSFVTARTPLEQVLANLIDNAVKHHDREEGVIEVRCRDLGSHYELEVADDGPGIEPEFRERVLRPFQTLEPRDRVEGAGMGLAIVKKRVQAAGGHVRIEDRPERGVSIRFTWPKTWPGGSSA